MRLGFLLGAGVSLGCGAPRTRTLTEMVLRGDNVQRYSDGTYYLSTTPPSSPLDPAAIKRILDLLKFLKKRADKFFKSVAQRETNYEDLYYLVTQLADAEAEFENPALSTLLKDVRRNFLYPPFRHFSVVSPEDLLEEAQAYIKGIIADKLSQAVLRENHLAQLLEAARDDSVSGLEIFTVNHDLLIEGTFKSHGVGVVTGFAPVSEDLSCWDRREFVESRHKVRLYKLHGSVNWYSVRFESDRTARVCIARQGDIRYARGPDGNWCTVLRGPEMLIGTFNKMLQYTMGIYADLFCAFRSALWSLDRLVISGYSFSDKGVNASISEWMREDPRRKALIIAPRALSYTCTARGAIQRLLSECRDQFTMWNLPFERAAWRKIRAWVTS